MTLFNNTPVKSGSGDLPNPPRPIWPSWTNASGVNFAWYRTVLWSPTQLKQFENRWSGSGHNHRFLDAYTFYYLMRDYLGGNNNHRRDLGERQHSAASWPPVRATRSA